MKLILKRGTTKTNKPYYMLCAELTYTHKALSFNISDIAEILGISVNELVETYVEEKEYEIGEIKIY